MAIEPAAMSRDHFLATFGPIFEHSAWIAENVWERFDGQLQNNVDGLHQQMCDVVAQATEDQKLALLNAHPQLGCALSEPDITNASIGEQTRSGLDQCSEAEYAEFQTLNQSYQAKFGFPFILAIKGYQRHEILHIFRQRFENRREDEFKTAIEQVMKIGLFRLRDIIQ